MSGIFRNWFRVYAPQGAKLTEGLGSEVEITSGEELGKTYFEGFFTLRPESKTKIVLTYELPKKFSPGDDYRMLVQKQPGTHGWKYTIMFNGQVHEFNLDKDTEWVAASR